MNWHSFAGVIAQIEAKEVQEVVENKPTLDVLYLFLSPR